MNQKEYELIAEVFSNHRRMYGNRTDSVTLEIINDMAEALESTYTNFDRAKFLNQCGVKI